MSRTRKEQSFSVANYLIYKSVGKYFQPNQNIGNATSRFDNKMLFIFRLLYFVRKLYKIHVSKLHQHGYHAAICWQTADKNRFYVKNVVLMYEKKKNLVCMRIHFYRKKNNIWSLANELRSA